MKTRISLIATLGVAALSVTACSKQAESDDALQKDLASAWEAKDVALARTPANNPLGADRPQGHKTMAAAKRAKVHAPARLQQRSEPANNEWAEPVNDDVEVAQASEPALEPQREPEVNEAPVAAPRPQPVYIPTSGRGNGGGINIGTRGGVGGIVIQVGGVILRGGVIDGDECDPRTDGRRGRGGRGGISIGRTLPPILRYSKAAENL